MRTERQRRERQMLDIAKAREAKTHEFERARKVAEVTARLRPPVPKVELRPTFDYANLAHAHRLSMAKLKADLDKMVYEMISTLPAPKFDVRKLSIVES